MTVAQMRRAMDTNPWMKRAGAFGFMFFLVKGLLWLAAPLIFYVFV